MAEAIEYRLDWVGLGGTGGKGKRDMSMERMPWLEMVELVLVWVLDGEAGPMMGEAERRVVEGGSL